MSLATEMQRRQLVVMLGQISHIPAVCLTDLDRYFQEQLVGARYRETLHLLSPPALHLVLIKVYIGSLKNSGQTSLEDTIKQFVEGQANVVSITMIISPVKTNNDCPFQNDRTYAINGTALEFLFHLIGS